MHCNERMVISTHADMWVESDEWKVLTDTNKAKSTVSPNSLSQLYTPMISEKNMLRLKSIFEDIEEELNSQ